MASSDFSSLDDEATWVAVEVVAGERGGLFREGGGPGVSFSVRGGSLVPMETAILS